MTNWFRKGSLLAVLLATRAVFPQLACAQQSCKGLSSLTVPKGMIISAEAVPAGEFTPSADVLGKVGPVTVPAFCRVAGVLKPSADSNIKFEVWMPATGWNGKFEDVGNGGFAGLIMSRSMVEALKRGYSTASTDDGHVGMVDVSWAIGHPEKVIDFGYRAVHETALASKAIIHSHYGKEAKRSYFDGCSDGGREALMEAQRFPLDFDGIIVGAPANYWTHQITGFVWNEQATLSDPASYIPASKLPVLQAAALGACRDLEGAKEGILEDPRPCHFDPAAVQCKDGDGPNCLTAQQVEAAKKIYAGPRNSRTGEQIYPGYEPGAEAAPGNWPTWITGAQRGQAFQFFFGNAFFANMVFADPKWDFRTLNFGKDIQLVDQKFSPILNSINPDLRRFQARGGKMIQYHGWADAAVAPRDSIRYYQSVTAFMYPKAVGGKDSNSLHVSKRSTGYSWCREWATAQAAREQTTSAINLDSRHPSLMLSTI